MSVLREIRRRARFIAGPVLGISLMGYFGYHLVEGERGLRAWLRLSQQIKEAQAQLIARDLDREALDRKVAALRPEHLDPDMLDEQARATLDLAGPHEIVILRGNRPH